MSKKRFLVIAGNLFALSALTALMIAGVKVEVVLGGVIVLLILVEAFG